MAISRTDIYDFLVDIVPREDAKHRQEDGNETGIHVTAPISTLGDPQTWPSQTMGMNGMIIPQFPYQTQQLLQMMHLQQLQQHQFQQSQQPGQNQNQNLNQIQQNPSQNHTQQLVSHQNNIGTHGADQTGVGDNRQGSF